MSKTFSVDYSGLRMDFKVLKDKKVVMLYAGLDSHKAPRIKKCEETFHHFVEVGYFEGSKNKNRGLKLSQTGYGESYEYVSHSVSENEKGKELVIITKNLDLEVESHYVFYKGAKAVTSYNVVKNISLGNITLTFVPSYYNQGISKANSKDMYLYQCHNSWHCEAQWVKNSFLELGIFNGNDFTSMKRYSINNTGSWSTKEHLPMVVIENKKRHECTLVEIENNGSWHIEFGDFVNEVYLSASGPEFYDNQWLKKLAPKETFKSVQSTITFGESFEDVIQQITIARRLHRRPSKDIKEMPVIFNDYMHALWDTQTTELILPLVDIASSVGCDEFCIDAGWFAEGSAWWDIVGEWEECPKNFPNGGFKKVIDYIKSKGMGAGIWLEIEAVGENSPLVKKVPDNWFFMVNGQKVLNNRRYQLNFANPEVYKYAMDVIDRLMRDYNLDYFKIDYNVDAGIGNEWESDSLGDGLLKHNRAYIKWLNEVLDKYPNLTIESCASGGCRMDNEILKYCSIQSTSDQTNYRKYPYLSTNVLTACTPEQAAVWSYPLNDHEKIMPTDEVVIMNMCNAMLGRIHLASFINKLPENQLDLIREGIKYYHSISNMKKESVPVFPRGTSYFFDKEVAGGIKNDSKLILGVWNTSGKPRTVKINLGRYNPKELKVGYPTSTPTEFKWDKNTSCLEVTFPEDYGGRIFEIKL